MKPTSGWTLSSLWPTRVSIPPFPLRIRERRSPFERALSHTQYNITEWRTGGKNQQPMDSQVTLIDLPPPGSSTGRIVLEFSVDDIHNTTVRDRGGGSSIYIVESSRDVNTTKIYRVERGSDSILIALIERKSIVPDRITVFGGDSMRIGKFLKSKGLSQL